MLVLLYVLNPIEGKSVGELRIKGSKGDNDDQTKDVFIQNMF